MVDYRKYLLDNGLTVLTHETWDTPLACVNLLYNVGARDEDPERTGFAHLFEHLMFGGTRRVPDFDAVVNSLGGESNAFTNNDYTNYYMTVPASSLGTALALEADRMSGLHISATTLAVQQRVVTEEYHQRYMNQPYGDVWLNLRPLCYRVYPYRWCTIGADIRHVSEASLADVEAFHRRFYRPDNAILAVAAPLKHEEQLALVREAFEGVVCDVEVRGRKEREYPAEPEQREAREVRVQRDVPATMVYMAFPMCDHFDARFRVCDLVSDVLANGRSSRMYRRWVQQERMMTEAEACITGDAGPGLLVLSGRLCQGVSADEGLEALREEGRRLAQEGVTPYELEKVVNKYESTYGFSQYKPSDRALGLCYYTWLGDTDLINREPQEYRRIRADEMQDVAKELFVAEHENRMVYGN